MRVVILGDCHFPFIDRRAWDLALAVIEAAKPTHVCQVGDFADMDAVNMHGKEFGRKLDLDKELKSASAGMRELQATCDLVGAELDWLEGNHETRLKRYMAKNASAAESMLKTLPEAIGFKGTWHEYGSMVWYGQLGVVHDVGHAGKYAMHQSLDTAGHCIAIGHTHRAGDTYDGDAKGDRRVCMNVGWLGNAAAMTYLPASKKRAWQPGAGIADIIGRQGLAFAHFVPFVKGRAVVDGKEVRA